VGATPFQVGSTSSRFFDLHSDTESCEGLAGTRLVGGRQDNFERRKIGGVFAQKPVALDLTDIENEKRTKAMNHSRSYGFHQQDGRVEIGCDEIRRVG
jgi:hypothetical protein